MPSLQDIIKKRLEERKNGIISEASKLYDDDGNLINENGDFINEDGYVIDVDGNLLDEDGNIIDEQDMEDDDDDEDEEYKDKKKKKEKVKVKESLEKVFSKLELDEDTTQELETLFNTCVAEAVDDYKDTLEEANEIYIDEFITEAEKNIDTYLSYVAKEWLEENEVAVESGIKVEISENLINGMHTLFTENYVEVPESKVDLIGEAEETIDSLIEKLDKSQDKTIELQEEINKMKSQNIVDELAIDLTESQKEKLGTLIDSIEYKDDDDYKKRVGIVIENYFSDSDELDEDVGSVKDTKNKKGSADKKDERVSSYIQHLSKKH